MRRRDTIIIAVLVNAALLLVLFATAMRTDSKKAKGETQELAKEDTNATLPEIASPLSSSEDVVMEILGGEEIELSSLDGLLDIAQMDAPAAAANSTNAGSGIAEMQIEEIAKVQNSSSTLLPAPIVSEAFREIVQVTVKKGDALEKIARAHKSTVSDIMHANNLNSTQLKIGQVLKVPSNSLAKKENSIASTKPESVPVNHNSSGTPSSKEDFYTVKEGDNPWMIANKLGLKLEELLRINNLDDKKAKKLRPGDRLRVR